MILTDLNRWIKASVIKHCRQKTEGQFLFVEGEDRLTSDKSAHFELRIDGPYSKPLDKGSHRHYIEVNVLANMKRDESNFYAHANLQGIAAEMLNTDICIYKIGNQDTKAQDNGSLVGVMQLIPNDQIKTSDFGQIDIPEVFQSVTEAHYEMYTSDD